MEQVTANFLAEIRKSHRVFAYVEVTGPNNETFRLPTIAGSVNVDRTASVRRTCTATCIDEDGTLVPEAAESILTPYGTTIRPYRGVIYSDGTTEVVPLGVFRLSKVTVKDQVGGSPDIQLEAYDRSREVSRDKFTSIYTVDVGTNVITAIKAILAQTFPDMTYDSISTSLVTTAPQMYDVGSDPWEAVVKLASSLGCEIYFDVRGTCVIAPPVDISALPSPDFTYNEGPECTMLDLSRVFTDEPGFNGVVVTGESPGDELPAVRAIVWDDEPSSATYHLGPYGEVPMFVTDQIVKTVEDATAMAKALLSAQLGFSSQLSLSSVVNPALEVGDTIEVTRERTRVSGLYTIDALNVSLGATVTQAITVRQKRKVG